jgi:nucleoside-diphosphate-sugar epimerase
MVSFAETTRSMADIIAAGTPSSAPTRRRNILVTGARSGLGHAVHSALGGIPVVRGTRLDDPAILAAAPFDAIVHCAVNAAKYVSMSTAYDYMADNFLLTQRLVDIPHRKFILVSTLAVYPPTGRAVSEDEDVDLMPLTGPYAFSKLFSDLYVQKHASNPLILRTTTLLGPAIRPSTVLRALTQRNCRLFLAAHSRYNFVMHDDIVDFMVRAMDEAICGAFNIGSEGLVVLSDVVDQLGLSVTYGDFHYDIGPVDVRRAGAVHAAFARPSWQTLNRYIDSLGSAYIGRGRLGPTPEPGSRLESARPTG